MISLDPEAFTLGPLHIRWYGVMAATGLVCAYWLLTRRAKRYGMTGNDVSDMMFWAMVAALIGARGLYVIRFWNDEFASQPFISVFRIYEGGLVFFGGFAAAAVAVMVLSFIRKWKLTDAADLIAPALALGHACGRIGCLLNGCCFGFEYSGPLAFKYAHVPHGTFPLQMFSAIGNVLICLCLLWLERKGLFKKRLFLIYMVLYNVGRFCLEFGRGDYPREQLLFGLTPAQVTCLWLLPCVVAVYLVAFYMQRRCPAKGAK
ncbi:MAG: prolipoprotein diacylglyceryl transferase [Victivallales bacterium]|nr:prolipoprotein diacylglyceryl transferase [Victivallales bacterium]